MNRRNVFPLALATALSLGTSLLCRGQVGAAPTANSLPRSPEPTPSAEAKEKAEDAALVQQLETEEQQNRNEPRTKGLAPVPVMRGGGGGFATAGGVFHDQNLMIHGQDFLTRTRPASRALVIRTSEADPKTDVGLEEDLAVMSHLLNKALEELPGGAGNGNKVMGIDVFFSPGGAPLRSLYLDNYGAVFFLSVNFPLVAPAEKHDEEKVTGDTAWEEARQELYGQRSPAGGEPAEDYSQEKVDKLKDTLFDALKNATNIRGLKSDEFVTVWVCGGTSGGRFRLVKGKPPGVVGATVITSDQVISPAGRTILTLRARKSEIDDYAKGKLSPEEFQKRTRLTAYTGRGGAGTDSLLMGRYTPRKF